MSSLSLILFPLHSSLPRSVLELGKLLEGTFHLNTKKDELLETIAILGGTFFLLFSSR